MSKLMSLLWCIATFLWKIRKKVALARNKPVPPMPGVLNPLSPNYIDPEKHGCSPGSITWEYLNVAYYQAFPEEWPGSRLDPEGIRYSTGPMTWEQEK